MRSGQANMDNVDEQGEYKIPPKGKYNVEILEVADATTKNGDPMLTPKFSIAEGEYQGCWIWDNIIISDDPQSPGFKILGRSKHFLHCINEPYKGDPVKWNCDNWVGRICRIKMDYEPPNENHKNTKAIVTEYILDDGIEQEELPL